MADMVDCALWPKSVPKVPQGTKGEALPPGVSVCRAASVLRFAFGGDGGGCADAVVVR